MRGWVIRGGEGGGFVDRFVEEGITGLAYESVDDLRKIDRWTIERSLEHAGVSPVDVHASVLISFLHEVVSGDLVVMPDPSRGEVVVGVVASAYDHTPFVAPDPHHHRRRVEWLARHPRADLPAVLADASRQRVPLRRVDSPSLDDYLAEVRAGHLGRPADQQVAPRALRAAGSTSGEPRRRSTPRRSAPASPRKAEVATRRCDGCFQTKPITQFDDDGPWCRDCA